MVGEQDECLGRRRWRGTRLELPTVVNRREKQHRRKHAPVGPNGTPELYGPPPTPPEPENIEENVADELPRAPPSSPDRSGRVTPSEKRLPPTLPRPVREPHFSHDTQADRKR